MGTAHEYSAGRTASKYVTAFLGAAAVLPFIPAVGEFVKRGIPDILFTGDGAALELGVLHAAHGDQFVGPYSRYGWSHPGPAFFYLALPIYEVFERRGPALNLVALMVNLVSAVALVLTARQLRGNLFGLFVAALLAIYTLAGVPFVLTNEWNPILPMLPLALLCLLTACLALGAWRALPTFAFIASVIVQTHIGYAAPVLALSLVAAVAGRKHLVDANDRSTPAKAWILISTGAVLLLCWTLPLYEALTERPGNLQRLIAFFAPDNLAVHPWSAAVTTVLDQMSVMPLALARALRLPVGDPSWPVVVALGIAQITALAGALIAAARRRDTVLMILSIVGVVEIVAAIVAVRAIRAEIEFYLVAWTSLIGFMVSVILVAWFLPAVQRRLPARHWRVMWGIAALMLLGLALSEPVPRGPVFREPDLAAEELARSIERYVRSEGIERPMIRIASHASWPTVAAVVLHLHKGAIPIVVESDWLFMMGKRFASPGGDHPSLLFGDEAFDERARSRRDVAFVSAAGGVYVYLEREQ